MTSSLRERQREQVRVEVHRAALELFAEAGYDAVRVETIAERAGISLSTLFRHVEGKEELLVGVVRSGRRAIVDAFAERPETEPVAASLDAAILHRTAQFADESDVVELWRRAMSRAPARVRRTSLLSDGEVAELTILVAERMGLEPAVDVAPGAVVRARLAAAEHAFEHWLVHASDRTLHELTSEALAAVG